MLRLLLLLGILSFGIFATHIPPFDGWLTKDRLIAALDVYRASPYAGVLHALLFVVLSCAALPATPLMFAAGYLFGFGWGTLYNWVGAVAAAVVSYGFARWLGGEAIEAILRRRVASFRAAGFRTTLWLRVIPVFPFAGVNFGAGAAKVPFLDYFLATLLGMIPSCISFTLFSFAAGEVWTQPTFENSALFALSILVGGIGIMIPIWMHRRAKRKQAEQELAIAQVPAPPKQARDPH